MSYKKNITKKLSTSQQSIGFSLIELLIALVIFSTLVAGVGSAYLRIWQQQKQQELRQQVLTSLTELVQRRYRNPSVEYFSAGMWQQGAASGFTQINCSQQNCSASELRDYDVQWMQQVLASASIDFSLRPCLAGWLCLSLVQAGQMLVPALPVAMNQTSGSES